MNRFVQDPDVIYAEVDNEPCRYQPTATLLCNMIHVNLCNYWNGVKIMRAHQALSKDTAPQHRATMDTIATQVVKYNFGVREGPTAQLALQRHKKQVDQDCIDLRDARRQRKQDVLDEMHGMKSVAR